MKFKDFSIPVLIVFFTFGLSGCLKPSADKVGSKTTAPQLENEAAADEYPNWKTFENKNHKFSFKYPQEWIFVPEVEKASVLTAFLKREDPSQEKVKIWNDEIITPVYQIAIRVDDNPKNLSAKEFELSRYVSGGQEVSKGLQDITIADVQGFKTSGPITPPGSGSMTSFVLGPDNGKIYSFTYTADAYSQTHEKFLPELEQILSTLKFY